MSEDLANFIDHTLLSPEATSADISRICSEAEENKFFAVCVNPIFVRQAVKELSSCDVTVATVVGFPLGANLTDIKIAEAQRAISEGAEELDLVINIGALKEGNLDYVLAEILSVVKVAKGKLVKVIIECGLLSQEEKIAATKLCIQGGAGMVKTSTGFAKNGVGATVEDVQLLREVIAEAPLKIKASGGIKDAEQARALINAGASRIGSSASVAIVQAGKLAPVNS
jgi:deoxyribose-phosphate aldolase